MARALRLGRRQDPRAACERDVLVVYEATVRRSYVLSSDGNGLWHAMHLQSRGRVRATSHCDVFVDPTPAVNPIIKPILTCLECAVALYRMVP